MLHNIVCKMWLPLACVVGPLSSPILCNILSLEVRPICFKSNLYIPLRSNKPRTFLAPQSVYKTSVLDESYKQTQQREDARLTETSIAMNLKSKLLKNARKLIIFPWLLEGIISLQIPFIPGSKSIVSMEPLDLYLKQNINSQKLLKASLIK